MWVSLSSMGIGLLTSYTMYGYLQEKIMSKSHAGIAAAIYMQRCRHGNSLRPRHPVYAYAPVSLFNFASTLCQYEALKYVSFTTQTLGASSKMVPVVLLGKLVCGKQYKWRNLLAVGLVTLGVTLYMTTTYDFTSESRSSTLRGLLLLAGYLIFDGLVSTTETVLSEPKVELVYDQILWTNICSLGVSIIVVLIDHKRSFGHLLDMLKMPSAYQLISDITLLSLSASIGLIFLLTTIATFGALTCGTMTSARPFLSIFINSAAFRTGRHLGIGGWIGIGFVGSAVYLELAHECEAKDKDHGLSSSRTTKRNARQHGYFAFPIIGGLIAHILSTVLIPANGALLVSKMFPTGPSFAYRNQTYSREDIRRLSKKADCPDQTAYATPIPRTVLASFPRSGNTLTRELVEHSTGFHTVDAKCGHAREMSYFSEGCKYPDNNFLVKDHVPVIRNPLDAIWSYWHLMRSRMDHKKRIEGIDILGLMNLSELDRMAQNWVQHTDYWTSTDRPKVLLRYEDLRGDDQIQHLARVLQMLLPADQLPPIERLICADDDRAVAYQSRKAEPFYSWDHFSPEVRSHILSVVKGNWCALGYETILRKQRGHMGIDCD
uniref:Sulfotransferase domain-containing protein n=1 Tax=Kwoniella bestiolae CBS 10118 TaxID=1296100 RepID=A0A1B9FVC8_9TREE|nr:hypothetical protein I302_08362 [Kwoniella bestiolae CBS 10118]OCF22711.1 hypothetical protein I302_08362 [Kwoniella bestiolae CBS 10118]